MEEFRDLRYRVLGLIISGLKSLGVEGNCKVWGLGIQGEGS